VRFGGERLTQCEVEIEAREIAGLVQAVQHEVALLAQAFAVAGR
jgi:hypothetical protein